MIQSVDNDKDANDTMKIEIDGITEQVSPEQFDDWEALVNHIRDIAAKKERTIMGWNIGDKDLADIVEKRALPDCLQDDVLLKVTTCTVPELASSTLEGLDEHLASLGESHTKLADLLLGGSEKEALEELVNVIEVWQAVMEGLDHISRLMNISHDFSVEGASFTEHTQKIVGNLQQLQDALRNKDFVSVSDILEFDLTPAITPWRAIVSEVSGKIDS